LKPDLVFLDVQMPGWDGLELLRRVAPEHLPAVVFVTAHDRYAVTAFDLDAVDFVLKPITPKRVQAALRRVRLDLDNEQNVARRHNDVVRALDAGAQEAASSPKYVSRFAVRKRDRFIVIEAPQITWIEAFGNYVQLHANGDSFLLLTTMAELE